MDFNFLVRITKGEERTLMKAFAVLSPFVYSVFYLYVPQFRDADIILRCALLASAIIALLYLERGLFGLFAARRGLMMNLKIPIPLYIGPVVLTSSFLLLQSGRFSSGITLPLFYWIPTIFGVAWFFSSVVRAASSECAEDFEDLNKNVRATDAQGNDTDVPKNGRNREGKG